MTEPIIRQTWTNDNTARFATDYPMRPGPNGCLHQYQTESAVLAQAMREAGERAPYFLVDIGHKHAHPLLTPETVTVVRYDDKEFDWPVSAVGPVGDEELEAFWSSMDSGLQVRSITLQFRADHPNGVTNNYLLPVSYWATGDWDAPTLLHTHRWNAGNVEEFVEVLCEVYHTRSMDERRVNLMREGLRIYVTQHLQSKAAAARLALTGLLNDFEHTYLFADEPQTVDDGRFALTLGPLNGT